MKKQLQYESDEWKRMFEFVMTENSILKNRLAELLAFISADQQLLNSAEYYLGHLLRIDEIVQILRKEVGYFDESLLWENRDNTHNLNLWAETEALVKEFNRVRVEFNGFLRKTEIEMGYAN
jgi:hypothetical protein